MPGLTLYDYTLDDGCYRVRLALSLLRLECRLVAVNVVPGNEQASPAFLAMNPLGRLPILRDDDLILNGTEAILAHLARAHDAAGTWLPAAGEDFAKVMQWLVFSARDLASSIDARYRSLFDTGGSAGGESRLAARKALRIMDDHMTARAFSGEDWFAGRQATIADIALFPAFALSRDFGVDHDEFPALRRWARRFRALPGFITMPGIPDYH